MQHRRSGWLACCVVALVIATDYQLRWRSGEQSLEGSIDPQVIFELVVYGLVGVYFVSRLRLSRVGRPRGLPVILWTYVAVMTFTVLYSPVPVFALARASELAVCLILVVTIDRTASRTDLHRMAHAFVAVVVVSVGIGLAAPTSFSERQTGRFTWLKLHPNAAGLLLALAVIIVSGYLFAPRLRSVNLVPRSMYVLAYPVLWGALLATRSRSALGFGLLAVGAVVLAGRPRGRRLQVTVVMTLVGMLVWLLASSLFLDYAKRGQDDEALRSLSSRTDLWDVSWAAFREQPLLGHGPGTAREMFTFEFNGVGGAHNGLLEVLIDAGLVGAGLWLALVLGTVRAAWQLVGDHRWRGGHPDGPILLGIVVFLVLSSLTAQGLGQPGTQPTLWIVIVVGWVLVARRTMEVP